MAAEKKSVLLSPVCVTKYSIKDAPGFQLTICTTGNPLCWFNICFSSTTKINLCIETEAFMEVY